MTNSVPSEGSDPQKDPNHPEGSWEAIRKWFGKYLSQVLFFLGGLALYLLLGLFLWWLFQLYIDPSAIENAADRAKAKKDLLQAVGLVMAGVAGAIGIYFTWRGQRLTQEGLEDSSKNTQAQLDLTRRGQITDRFTKAIEHLGGVTEDNKPQTEVRLGGIYALERIAKESVEQYGEIMEILAAYIRVNSPWPPKNPTAVLLEDEIQAWARWHESDAYLSALTGTPNDIQAILDVFRRREETHVPIRYRVSLNLNGADLRKMNLIGINFAGASLNGANLQDAWLAGANLESAELIGANLQRTWLSGAKFKAAMLHDAQLEGADLGEATLENPSPEVLRSLGQEGAEAESILMEAADLREVRGLYQTRLELATGEHGVRVEPYLRPDVWELGFEEQLERIRRVMTDRIENSK